MSNNQVLGFAPALGWNSWNTFTWDINEQLIRDVADVFVSEGYLVLVTSILSLMIAGA